jgi:hypothetical protein
MITPLFSLFSPLILRCHITLLYTLLIMLPLLLRHYDAAIIIIAITIIDYIDIIIDYY